MASPVVDLNLFLSMGSSIEVILDFRVEVDIQLWERDDDAGVLEGPPDGFVELGGEASGQPRFV